MIKKVLLLIVAVAAGELKAMETTIDPLRILVGVGCLVGAAFTGSKCTNAFETMVLGTATIESKNQWGFSMKKTAVNFLKDIKDKESRGEDATMDRLLYANLRFGPIVGWVSTTFFLGLMGLILIPTSFKKSYQVSY